MSTLYMDAGAIVELWRLNPEQNAFEKPDNFVLREDLEK